jgi:hypothetical protein
VTVKGCSRERVAVAKLNVNQICCNGTGSIKVHGLTYASEIAHMVVADL